MYMCKSIEGESSQVAPLCVTNQNQLHVCMQIEMLLVRVIRNLSNALVVFLLFVVISDLLEDLAVLLDLEQDLDLQVLPQYLHRQILRQTSIQRCHPPPPS